LIDIRQGKLTFRVQDSEVTFNMSDAVDRPIKNKECFRVDKLEKYTIETSITKESQIDDSLSEESICAIKTPITPWYADVVNYLASGVIPADFSCQRKKKFLSDVKYYRWEDPLLYKHCGDQIIRRCIPERRHREYSSSLPRQRDW